jgi:hypothetical protein
MRSEHRPLGNLNERYCGPLTAPGPKPGLLSFSGDKAERVIHVGPEQVHIHRTKGRRRGHLPLLSQNLARGCL